MKCDCGVGKPYCSGAVCECTLFKPVQSPNPCIVASCCSGAVVIVLCTPQKTGAEPAFSCQVQGQAAHAMCRREGHRRGGTRNVVQGGHMALMHYTNTFILAAVLL